jgi:hypothetical protein
MPYVSDDEKDRIDSDRRPPVNVGQLTYVIQGALRVYLEGTGLRYQNLAECLGALEGAKLDLIDRVIIPYEHKKRVENGDVWPPTLSPSWASEHD